MNKDLKNRSFNVPQDILDKINHTISGLNGKNVRGIQRAKKLLQDKSVKYGQLKRIIHDIKNMDKVNEKTKYDLCGGDMMEKWAITHLQGERDLISNTKDSKKRADEIGGITGERKNSHLKSHTKKSNFKIPTNLLKSNSNKSSISSITSLGLFEELEKIKKLIIY
jgi:nitrous oxide reductase